MLRPDLTFSVTSTRHHASASGQLSTGPDDDAGVYTVTPDARVVLDSSPSTPGVDVTELGINPAATMMVFGRGSADIESWIGIGLRSSTGQSNSSLNGSYHVFNNRFDESAGGLTSSSIKGTVGFDGAGNWSFSGEQQSVTAAGVASRSPVTDNGTYSIASDGALTFSPQSRGAISLNGDVFFLADFEASRSDVCLTVGVRAGTSYDMNALTGDWVFADQEIELGTRPTLPLVFTETGVISIAAQSATAGTYSGEGSEVESDPTGIYVGPDSFHGTATLLSNGTGLFRDSAGGAPLELSFAGSGDVFGAAMHQGITGMILGLRTCASSGPFGTATAGTGAIPPATDFSGFPFLGNSSFALRVTGGRGGAASILLIATGPSAGVPFLGGTIWLDFGQVILTPTLLLSGAPGAAGVGEATLPLAVPSLPSLAGVSLYTQAVVIDPAAPAGLSMSSGFRVAFCR